MRSRWFSMLLGGVLLATPAVPAAPFVAAKVVPSSPTAPGAAEEKAIFAGGCFWCEENAFEDLPGVTASVSGYTGGTVANPTYEQVSSGTTGHFESAEVTFDPAKISYDKLLDVYWHNIDPTQADGQFCDHGSQYRTAIFYMNDAQKKAAEASKAKLEQDPRFKGRIATQILPAGKFYRAEEYHQNFCKLNPLRYTSYYQGCGRGTRLKQVWGDEAGGHR